MTTRKRICKFCGYNTTYMFFGQEPDGIRCHNPKCGKSLFMKPVCMSTECACGKAHQFRVDEHSRSTGETCYSCGRRVWLNISDKDRKDIARIAREI